MTQIIKFNEFFARSSDVLPENSELEQILGRLPNLSKNGPWLAGGSIRRTLQRQSVLESDFDFFFKNQEQFDTFVKQVKESGGWQVGSNKNNVTLRMPSVAPESVDVDEFEPYKPEIKIQAIKLAFYESIEQVIDSFDFTICQFGFDGENLYFGDYSLWDLGRKRLVPHKISYATSSLRRLLKYTKAGFTICGGGLASMLDSVVKDPNIIQADTLYID